MMTSTDARNKCSEWLFELLRYCTLEHSFGFLYTLSRYCTATKYTYSLQHFYMEFISTLIIHVNEILVIYSEFEWISSLDYSWAVP